MDDLPRRGVLAATGSAIIWGASGCFGHSRNGVSRTEPVSADLQDALGYVYRPAELAGQPLELRIHNLAAGAGAPAAEGVGPVPFRGFTIDWVAQVRPWGDRVERIVAAGTLREDLAPAANVARVTKRNSVTVYEAERRHYAVGEGILLAGDRDWIARVLTRRANGAPGYLERNPTVSAVLARVGVEEGDFVEVATDPSLILDGLDPEPAAIALVYRKNDADEVVALTAIVAHRDSRGTTAEDLRLALAPYYTLADVAVERDDDLLVLTGSTVDDGSLDRLDLPRPHFAGYDEATGTVEFALRGGESIAVEHTVVLVEGQRYKVEWARGKAEIGHGDVLAVDADAIRPGDSLSIVYRGPRASGDVGNERRVMGVLPFRFAYEPEAGRLAVTYGRGPPLAADRVTVRVVAQSGSSDGESARYEPWDGRVHPGDRVTIDEVPPGADVLVQYQPEGDDPFNIHGYSVSSARSTDTADGS